MSNRNNSKSSAPGQRTPLTSRLDDAQLRDRIAHLDSAEACEKFARNATRLERADLALEAVKRAIRLRASTHGSGSPIESLCLEAVFAREEALTYRNGRRTRAFRIWQLVRQLGPVSATERVVTREPDEIEYQTLIEMGLEEFAFERVVLANPLEFSDGALSVARRRVDAPREH